MNRGDREKTPVVRLAMTTRRSLPTMEGRDVTLCPRFFLDTILANGLA